MAKKFSILLVIYLICFTNSWSQSISNVRAIQSGQKIEINYDINNAGAAQEFEVTSYCSNNGGYSWGLPLKKVEGDVGKGVSAGKNKKIVWYVLNERDELVGDNIVFKITANPTKGYGNAEITATTMKDGRDAHEYKIILLGKNTWMTENLNFKTQEGCYCIDDIEKNCEENGYLYDWETAQEVCPSGWHLPSKDEFTLLIESFGSNEEAYPNLIIEGTSGFNAIFIGWRSTLGLYRSKGKEVKFWTSTEVAGTNAFAIGFDKLNKTINTPLVEKENAFSVRCVKDK
jgi:uncharacterized protein (TIGR02145 family)